jgi:hypothetical protein
MFLYREHIDTDAISFDLAGGGAPPVLHRSPVVGSLIVKTKNTMR